MTFWFEFIEGLRMSLAAVLANKLRSVLTTIGIVIGIVTVTLMATAIEGINRAFKESISLLGSDILFVQHRSWFSGGRNDWMEMMKRKPISWSQYETVQEQMTLARAVAPVTGTQQPLWYKSRVSNGVMMIGTTEGFAETSGLTVQDGRFFSGPESNGGRPVAVIGYQVATNLFVGESPLGKKLKLRNQTVEIVGVLERQGSFLGAFSWDNRLIVPLRFFVAAFNPRPDYEIQVKAESIEKMEETKEELRGVMRRARQLRPGQADDFAINQQDMFLKMFDRVAGMIATGGLFITGLSLFVGGIGIMNIMFVSVAERTREIGVRKAIGAKRRTILLQFLMEAAGICLLGGLIGLAIAWLGVFGLRQFMPAAMSWQIVTLALLVALATGLISGFLPAWRAARMNPVDALRSE